MLNKGFFLRSGDTLIDGEYLLSQNECFFAFVRDQHKEFLTYIGRGLGNGLQHIFRSAKPSDPDGPVVARLENNGVFCIYAAEKNGSRRPIDGRKPVWSSPSKPQPTGDYYAVIENDGDFCIYPGSGPNEKRGDAIWRTNMTASLAFEGRVIYELDKYKEIETSLPELDQIVIDNREGDVEQSSSQTKSYSVTEVRGWQHVFSQKITVKFSGELELPIVAKGRVELSSETGYQYSWNRSQSITRTYSCTVPCKASAGTICTAHVLCTISKISVPMKLQGTYIITYGGKDFRVGELSIPGTYVGSNSHTLTVKYITENGKPFTPIELVSYSSTIAHGEPQI